MTIATSRLTGQAFALTLLAWATACGDGPEPTKAPSAATRPAEGEGGAAPHAGGGSDAGGGGPAAGVGTGGSGGAAPDGGAGGGTIGATDCSDGNACTSDSAVGNGCQHQPMLDGTSCSDGNLCTTGDHCVAGTCVPGAPLETTLTERGRIDSFGSDVGAAVGWGRGTFLFVEPVGGGASLHLEASSPIGMEELARTGADEPGARSIYLARDMQPLLASWGEHAVIGAGFGSAVSLVRRAANDELTAEGRLELPLAGGFLQGTLNGVTGQGQEAWFCTNAAFFGAPFGTLYRYDLSVPAAPQLRQEVASPVDCGSLAISDDGARLYFNTRNGFYRFEPAVTDAEGVPSFEGPTFENAGLAIRGDRLLARGANALRIYRERDLKELRTIPVANVVGTAFISQLNLVATLRYQQVGALYERWLELYDAAPDAPVTPIDSVLVDRRPYPSPYASLAQSGDYLVEPFTKGLFRVSGRRLERVFTPQVGGVEAIVSEGNTLQVWGATSYRRLDLSDPTVPEWLPAPGPTLGRLRTAGLVLDGNAQLISPTGTRTNLPWEIQESVEERLLMARAEGGTYLQALTGAATDEVEGELLVAPTATGGRRLSRGDYLYSITFDTRSVSLSRIARGGLGTAGGPPPVETSIALPMDFLPAAGRVIRADFTASLDGKSGLVSVPYLPDSAIYNLYGGQLFWLDLTTSPPTLRGQVQLEQGLGVGSCRIAGRRAVCSVGDTAQLGFFEWEEDGTLVPYRVVSLKETGLEYGTPIAFDGTHAYLAYRTGLLSLPFTATEGALGASPLIPFHEYPRLLAEVEGGLVVSSGSELVLLSPECR